MVAVTASSPPANGADGIIPEDVSVHSTADRVFGLNEVGKHGKPSTRGMVSSKPDSQLPPLHNASSGELVLRIQEDQRRVTGSSCSSSGNLDVANSRELIKSVEDETNVDPQAVATVELLADRVQRRLAITSDPEINLYLKECLASPATHRALVWVQRCDIQTIDTSASLAAHSAAAALLYSCRFTATSLDLAKAGLGADGARLLSAALTSSRLSMLNLSNNPMLGATGAKYIAAALPGAKKLVTLNMSRCAICNTGVKYLMRVLTRTRLRELDLSYNAITDVGAYYVARVLPMQRSLDLLVLLIGNNVEADGRNALREVWPNHLAPSTMDRRWRFRVAMGPRLNRLIFGTFGSCFAAPGCRI